MVKHTFKILEHLLQDFKSVSDHFGTLCIKESTALVKKFIHEGTTNESLF